MRASSEIARQSSQKLPAEAKDYFWGKKEREKKSKREKRAEKQAETTERNGRKGKKIAIRQEKIKN